MTNFTTLARLITVAWILPILLSGVVYFGFASSYSLPVFSEAGFEQQYGSDVYKHRVLGILLLRETHRLIVEYDLPHGAPRALRILKAYESGRFYTAYFYHNTLWLCLACSVLFLLLNRTIMVRQPFFADLVLLGATLLMTVTQYVVVPYDTLSYFLLLSAFTLVLGTRGAFSLAALCGLTMLASLTRESAALVLSFYATIHFPKLVAGARRELVELGLLGASFAVPFLVLRSGHGGDLFQGIMLRTNLKSPYALAGLAFLAAALLVPLFDSRNRTLCLRFLALASPYLIMALLLGNTWETRMWVPVLLPLLILKLRPTGVPDSEIG